MRVDLGDGYHLIFDAGIALKVESLSLLRCIHHRERRCKRS